jgi:large subunit ribosomal protein L4
MLTAKYFSASGDPGDALELPEDLFDGIVNEAALHQVIKAYLANQRQGNASTKTRAEVSGGGKKIWKQKGTGRARQGSIRAPHWRHGGVAFGPRPRGYHQDVPKKMKALARRSAFNKRALNGEISVIERFSLEAARTRHIVALLGKVGLGEQKLLILTSEPNEMVYRSARNLGNVVVRSFEEVSAYDVLNARQLLIEAEALRPAEEVVNA